MIAAAAKRVGAFIATKEHRRFSEFADAVRKQRYIGICFGQAGIGKTLSARRYASWDLAEPFLDAWTRGSSDSDAHVYASLARKRTIFYTPRVGCPLRDLREDVLRLTVRVHACVSEHLHSTPAIGTELPELIVVDEAERLPAVGLEHLRDVHDRTGLGVILIGTPGIEKRLSRYPQLYSRVGFAHHYRPLQGEELTFVLTRHWRRLGLALDDADFTDTQAIASIARITGGNFRLLHRLFVQIERVLRINELSIITDDVVEAARSTLVIGAN